MATLTVERDPKSSWSLIDNPSTHRHPLDPWRDACLDAPLMSPAREVARVLA
jgi:hypothetical protein